MRMGQSQRDDFIPQGPRKWNVSKSAKMDMPHLSLAMKPKFKTAETMRLHRDPRPLRDSLGDPCDNLLFAHRFTWMRAATKK